MLYLVLYRNFFYAEWQAEKCCVPIHHLFVTVICLSKKDLVTFISREIAEVEVKPVKRTERKGR
jgi:hypothetical protein